MSLPRSSRASRSAAVSSPLAMRALNLVLVAAAALCTLAAVAGSLAR
jgi:hypothetical protein